MMIARSKFQKLSILYTVTLGDYVSRVICGETDDMFFAATALGELASFELKSGTLLWKSRNHKGGIQSLVKLNPHELIVSGGEDGKVVVSDFSSGSTLHATNMRSGSKKGDWVGHLGWSRRRNTLAVACGRELSFLTPALVPIGPARTLPGTVNGMGWDRSEERLATVSFGGGFLWTPDLETPLAEWKDKVAMIEMAWSPTEKYVACGCQDSAMLIWDVTTKENLKMWGYPGKVTHLLWDRTGRFLVTAGHGSLIIWDFRGDGPSGKEPITQEVHQDMITSISFNSKGTLLCSGAEDGSLIVWKSGSFDPFMYGVAPSPVTTITWSTTGQRIISGHVDGSVTVWSWL